MNAKSFSILSVSLAILYAAIGFGVRAANAAENTVNRKSNETWTQRVINEKELEALSQRDGP